MNPTKHVVECSECALYYSCEQEDVAQSVLEDHERRSGHKGPFRWTLTDELQHAITASRLSMDAEIRRRRGY